MTPAERKRRACFLLRDLLVYRMPSTVWPRFQILFWVIGVGEIALFLTPILLRVRN
jgi:hypothetical protein